MSQSTGAGVTLIALLEILVVAVGIVVAVDLNPNVLKCCFVAHILNLRRICKFKEQLAELSGCKQFINEISFTSTSRRSMQPHFVDDLNHTVIPKIWAFIRTIGYTGNNSPIH